MSGRPCTPKASFYQIIKQAGDYDDSKPAAQGCQSGNNWFKAQEARTGHF
jgi:hypothetical protein